ncbi:hypothetical protein HN709_01315 [Candidatus Peregrinibacteria bacterium]|nr:hypothetical protein [Candidatus Peregrinibacteria bacterium]
MKVKNVKSGNSDSTEDVVKIFDDADFVYARVLDKLKLPNDDEVFESLVLSTLKRQTKDHMVFAIWNNLDKKQAVHLRSFLAQTKSFADFLSTDDAVIEFALMYPLLLEKVYASLADFFIKFVDKFNKHQEL